MFRHKSALKTLTLGVSALALVAVGQISKADAASVLFSATGTNNAPFTSPTGSALGATVLFDDLVNPGKLTVTVTNTGAGAKAPSDILTSLFWDYNGSPLNLSLFSATAGTVTKKSTNTTTNNVNLLATPDNGKEWAYASNSTGLGGGVNQHYGLGTAGLGIFQGIGGQTQQAYGIINGYNSNANNPVKTNPLVNNTATFVLAGLPTSGFDVRNIQNIRFQYGTALNEAKTTAVNYSTYTPNPTTPPTPPSGGGGPKKIPEPATTTALGLFAASALGSRKRKALAQA